MYVIFHNNYLPVGLTNLTINLLIINESTLNYFKMRVTAGDLSSTVCPAYSSYEYMLLSHTA